MLKKIGGVLMGIIFIAGMVGLSLFVLQSKAASSPGGKGASDLHPALHWEAMSGGAVRCRLCPNHCVLGEGQTGFCRARKNEGGKLYSMVYGRASSVHMDPIEKKPLYHFMPGQGVYSLGTTGCNLQCKFCQNWQISQVLPWEVATKPMTPEAVVRDAEARGAKIIAFTYNEPTISYEYTLDIAKLARQRGIRTVMVSAGYIEAEPLRELLPYIDAYKIDLKGFEEGFYRELTSARLGPVLEALKIIKRSGVWLELVNLVIPGENDGEEEIRALSEWVRENLGKEVPLHFTRFHPDFKLLNKPPTPVETLRRCRRIALDAGLKYVYTGNYEDLEGSTTYSPLTGEALIVRKGFFVEESKVNAKGETPAGEKVPGIWQ